MVFVAVSHAVRNRIPLTPLPVAAIDHRLVCSSPQRCNGLRGSAVSLICLLGVSHVAAVLWQGLLFFAAAGDSPGACVCQPQGLSHSLPSARGRQHFPLPGRGRGHKMPAHLHRTAYLPMRCFFFFFFKERTEKW